MAGPTASIDREKLRAAIRRMGREYAFYFLDDAIDRLTLAQLEEIAKKYIPLERLRPDPKAEVSLSLLDEIKAFEQASRAGKYFVSFDVNSRNCTMKSDGTLAWISDFLRLMDRCVDRAQSTEPAELRESLEALFDLLGLLASGDEEILFWADEGGAWEVGVDWEKILPVWFAALSLTAGPNEYAQKVTHVLKQHYDYGSGPMLRVVRDMATAAQRKALGGTPTKTKARR